MVPYLSHRTHYNKFLEKIKKFISSSFAEEEDLVSNIEAMGYAHASKAALRAARDLLDKKASSLTSDPDAYYRNRLLSWSLTDKIVRR